MNMPLDDLSNVDDDSLLALYVAGDQAAANLLTGRLTPMVFGYANRMLGNRAEAEDVTQDAMMRLWKMAPNWRRGEAQISTWLYRVASNLCTDRLRKRRGVGLDEIAEPEDGQPSATQVIQAKNRAAALEAALAKLPDRQREAVVLRHIDGLANPQIAEIMEISTEAVESLTARGKRALAAILAGKRDELGYTDDA